MGRRERQARVARSRHRRRATDGRGEIRLTRLAIVIAAWPGAVGVVRLSTARRVALIVTPITKYRRWRKMQDADLLLSLGGIAGVFVGFGALISVRSGGPSEADEVSAIRWVVSLGIWVVIAALAPVIVSRYDIAGHDLWLVCSLLALVLFAAMFAMNGRAPETVAGRTAALAATHRATATAVVQAVPGVWLPTVSIALALAVVALGPFPDQDRALYLTAVGVGLFGAAITLLGLVFLQPYPAAARPAVPAPGGSSA